MVQDGTHVDECNRFPSKDGRLAFWSWAHWHHKIWLRGISSLYLQYFPTFSMLRSFNTVIHHVVVTPSHKILPSLLPNCHFDTAINCNVNIWEAGYWLRNPYWDRDPQVDHCLPSGPEMKNKGSSLEFKVAKGMSKPSSLPAQPCTFAVNFRNPLINQSDSVIVVEENGSSLNPSFRYSLWQCLREVGVGVHGSLVSSELLVSFRSIPLRAIWYRNLPLGHHIFTGEVFDPETLDVMYASFSEALSTLKHGLPKAQSQLQFHGQEIWWIIAEA